MSAVAFYLTALGAFCLILGVLCWELRKARRRAQEAQHEAFWANANAAIEKAEWDWPARKPNSDFFAPTRLPE